ncbi:MAG: hypothetical protein CSA53_03955 [Gammaproteobacteria bacterium]|nr:MAG: hypothetical protein CSA53_03955 [Gammaproteobacteria bacterium]
MMGSGKERRSYFRINDAVGLRFHELSDTEVGEGQAQSYSIEDTLRSIDREFNQLVNVLWQDNPSAANALGLLNRKMTLISEVVLGGGQAGVSEDFKETQVNISGAGIAFAADKSYPVGARLALTLQLRPSNTELQITGEVTACNKQEESGGQADGEYWLRVSFEPGNDAAQDRLVQHIVQRQCAMLEKNTRGEGSAPSLFSGFTERNKT